MYKAIDVAKYVVTKCMRDKCPVSNLQLQKILYYIQKDFLSRGEPAFSDDIEAWKFGPVVPNVYYHFCGSGAMPISISFENISIAPKDAEYIDAIIEAKRNMNPWELVDETHKENGAWHQIYYNEGESSVIPLDLIRTVG